MHDSNHRASAAGQGEDWYRTPLYYDIIFDQDTALESDFLEGAYQRHATARRGKLKVLEPACGSGRLMVELASRGHRVAGFDLEPAMMDYTQQRLAERGLAGDVEEGRMEQFSMSGGPFDFAYCLVSTFKYVLTERGARSHLRSVARHLRPGGIYILGFHLSKYDEAAPEPEPERWSGSRDGVSVDCKISSSVPDPESRVEHVCSELVIDDGGRPATLSTEWDFRTYDAAEVRSMLRGVPELSLETCYDFRYDLDEERELEDPWEDAILVLKRKG